jgi:hypothetical protein
MDFTAGFISRVVPAGHQLPAFWTVLRSVGCFGVGLVNQLLRDDSDRALESRDRFRCKRGESVGAEGRDGGHRRGKASYGDSVRKPVPFGGVESSMTMCSPPLILTKCLAMAKV